MRGPAALRCAAAVPCCAALLWRCRCGAAADSCLRCLAGNDCGLCCAVLPAVPLLQGHQPAEGAGACQGWAAGVHRAERAARHLAQRHHTRHPGQRRRCRCSIASAAACTLLLMLCCCSTTASCCWSTASAGHCHAIFGLPPCLTPTPALPSPLSVHHAHPPPTFRCVLCPRIPRRAATRTPTTSTQSGRPTEQHGVPV